MKRVLLALMIATLTLAAACDSTPYTAKVIDAETGEPVEGAVYLAAWWGTSSGEKAWFEGASDVMDRFVEGHSDAKGWIQVEHFWRRFPLAKRRTLTVYKPGYVLWNQEHVFPSKERRTGFTSKNREVRLEKWKDEYTYGRHEDFLTLVISNTLRKEPYSQGEKLLRKAFINYETNNH